MPVERPHYTITTTASKRGIALIMDPRLARIVYSALQTHAGDTTWNRNLAHNCARDLFAEIEAAQKEEESWQPKK